ncbi:formyltransferase family protein [Methylophilaceae bacterium]|jgi:methionyl-tRNA formyltransferase|nr:formyltransferase family protein [Methylophilaceae bacterium]
MKILCVGYRDWALNIYNKLHNSMPEFDFEIISNEKDFNSYNLESFSPEIILFYGWSSIIPKNITEKYNCLMLHPSALPKYRGGSPLQNQIIDGVLDSKATIFKMTNELDAGDILAASDLCLRGSIGEIFNQLEDIGFEMTKEILLGDIKYQKQDNSLATHHQRRSPELSELTLEEILNMDAMYLYNKIRMLGDPYPNAFIRTRDGKKLLIKCAEIEG